LPNGVDGGGDDEMGPFPPPPHPDNTSIDFNHITQTFMQEEAKEMDEVSEGGSIRCLFDVSVIAVAERRGGRRRVREHGGHPSLIPPCLPPSHPLSSLITPPPHPTTTTTTTTTTTFPPPRVWVSTFPMMVVE